MCVMMFISPDPLTIRQLKRINVINQYMEASRVENGHVGIMRVCITVGYTHLLSWQLVSIATEGGGAFGGKNCSSR